MRSTNVSRLVLGSLLLVGCGGELPSTSLPEVSTETVEPPEPLPEPEPEPEPVPEACVARDPGPIEFDMPVCEAMVPLRIALSDDEPIEVRAGESIELPLQLEETSGLGMYRYPGVHATTTHPAGELGGPYIFFGIHGCQSMTAPIVLSVLPSVPSGVVFDVVARVVSLEADCEAPHELTFSVRVL